MSDLINSRFEGRVKICDSSSAGSHVVIPMKCSICADYDSLSDCRCFEDVYNCSVFYNYKGYNNKQILRSLKEGGKYKYEDEHNDYYMKYSDIYYILLNKGYSEDTDEFIKVLKYNLKDHLHIRDGLIKTHLKYATNYGIDSNQTKGHFSYISNQIKALNIQIDDINYIKPIAEGMALDPIRELMAINLLNVFRLDLILEYSINYQQCIRWGTRDNYRRMNRKIINGISKNGNPFTRTIWKKKILKLNDPFIIREIIIHKLTKSLNTVSI